VVARIKVLANMDVAEHRFRRTARLHIKTPQGPIDMRVSMMPAVYGEMWSSVFSTPKWPAAAAEVGFSATDERRVRTLIDRNQVSYWSRDRPARARRQRYMRPCTERIREYHILTVEDPVEIPAGWHRADPSSARH